MNAQDTILGSRVVHIRELNAEIARLKRENAALRDENDAMRAHFAAALLAAEDLRTLPPDARFEIWDGWNLILGYPRVARDRNELFGQAKERLAAADGLLRIWIVFDGKDEHVENEPSGLRVSYTGGCGEHRADRFICDFVRMAAYRGLAGRIEVRTNDRDFRRKVDHIQRMTAPQIR